MKNRVSMKDIANELNITVDAVSKALRNSPRISEQLKKLVFDKAREIGYVKNNIALSLKSGKTNFVAVYLNSLLNPFFAVLSHKIIQTLKKYGYVGILSFCDSHLLEEDRLSNIFSNNCVGVITLVEPSEKSIEILKKNEIPIYVLGIKSDNSYVNYIVSDDYNGGRCVGNYFLKHNYKKALFFSDSLSGTSIERKQGFLDALAEFDSNSIFVLESSPTIDLSNELIDVVKKEGIDFIFSFSDYLALKVMHWIDKSDIPSRKDIKIIGYDNLCYWTDMYEHLSSVGYDMDEMCKVAIDCLDQNLKGKSKERLAETIDVKLFDDNEFNKSY